MHFFFHDLSPGKKKNHPRISREAEHKKRIHERKVKAAKAVIKLPGGKTKRPPSAGVGDSSSEASSQLTSRSNSVAGGAAAAAAASVSSSGGSKNDETSARRHRAAAMPNGKQGSTREKAGAIVTTRAKLLKGDIHPEDASQAVASLYENSVRRLAQL